LHCTRAIGYGERFTIGIEGVGVYGRRWEADDVLVESVHQEAPAVTKVATFVELHADEPPVKGAHAADASPHLP
jgi:hypothetical protein